ncbi:hypothetical protein GBAR_LOCUS28634, partial [Geodia barretti]
MMSGASNQVSTSTAVPPNLLQTEQLNSELKNLVGILTGKGAINLEQLLSGSHTSRPQLKPSTQSISTVAPSHSSSPSYTTSLATRKRGRTFDFEADSSKRRRGAQSYSSRQSGEKQHNKGLRHFSQRVCEKVREKVDICDCMRKGILNCHKSCEKEEYGERKGDKIGIGYKHGK